MSEFAQGNTSSVIMRGVAASAFSLQEGSRLRETKFGLDEITRLYIGPKALARAFASGQFTDPEFPGMEKVDHDISVLEGGMAAVTIDYRGRASTGGTFNLYKDPSSATSSAPILFYLSNGSTLTMTFQYLAPSTVYRWATDKLPPDTSPYTTVASSANPWDSIQNTRIQIPANTRITSSTIDDLIALAKKNKPVDTVVSYECQESVQGRYWECSAKVSRLITQPVTVQA